LKILEEGNWNKAPSLELIFVIDANGMGKCGVTEHTQINGLFHFARLKETILNISNFKG
jgi:hypothetical protein